MTQADSVHSTPPLNTSARIHRLRRLLLQPVGPVPLVAILTIFATSILVHALIAVTP